MTPEVAADPAAADPLWALPPGCSAARLAAHSLENYLMTQADACPSGSIRSGQTTGMAACRIRAFWSESSSAGRPFERHCRISDSSPITLSSLNGERLHSDRSACCRAAKKISAAVRAFGSEEPKNGPSEPPAFLYWFWPLCDPPPPGYWMARAGVIMVDPTPWAKAAAWLRAAELASDESAVSLLSSPPGPVST